MDEQVEVVVIIAPPDFAGRNPRGYLLAEGTLANGFLVWLVFVTTQIANAVRNCKRNDTPNAQEELHLVKYR